MAEKSRYIITLDDDPTMGKFLSQATGIVSIPFHSGHTLRPKLKSFEPIAVFVDVHLGDGDCGLDIIGELRLNWQWTPIFVITSDIDEKIIGQALALGANDFLRKPLSIQELLARLQTRIAEMEARKNINQIKVIDFTFCKLKSALEKSGKVAYLPPIESQLLIALAETQGLRVPREDLKSRVWGRLAISDNTLDKKVSTVRKALVEIGSSVNIKSIYGQGLILQVEKSKFGEATQ